MPKQILAPPPPRVLQCPICGAGEINIIWTSEVRGEAYSCEECNGSWVERPNGETVIETSKAMPLKTVTELLKDFRKIWNISYKERCMPGLGRLGMLGAYETMAVRLFCKYLIDQGLLKVKPEPPETVLDIEIAREQ